MTKIKLIAEVANYWHGDETLLTVLCQEAAVCQCDYFKIQVYNPALLGNRWKSRLRRYKNCEITHNRLLEMIDSCENFGIDLLCTINTPDRVELLHDTHVNNVKIASGQIHPFLIREICKYEWEKVFVSTGMISDCEDLNRILPLFDCAKEVVIMHCVSLYPTHDSEMNLLRIQSLKEAFPEASIGYSDHAMDDLACTVAIGLGARYIEKHFKISGCYGPTSEIASDDRDMAILRVVTNRIGRMIGDGRLSMQEREKHSLEHYADRYLMRGGLKGEN